MSLILNKSIINNRLPTEYNTTVTHQPSVFFKIKGWGSKTKKWGSAMLPPFEGNTASYVPDKNMVWPVKCWTNFPITISYYKQPLNSSIVREYCSDKFLYVSQDLQNNVHGLTFTCDKKEGSYCTCMLYISCRYRIEQ